MVGTRQTSFGQWRARRMPDSTSSKVCSVHSPASLSDRHGQSPPACVHKDRPVLPSCAVSSLQNAPSLAHPSGRDVLCAVSSPSHQTDFCTSLCSQCLCARGDGCQAHKGHHCRVRPEVLCFHGTGASCCSWYFCCLCSGSSPLNTCNM